MFKNSKFPFVRNLSSFFYALAITLGIYISIEELHRYNNISNFVVFSFAILLIYCIELFTTYQSKSSKVEINFDIEDEINELSHFFHKLILPILLYFSLLAFGYYNYDNQNLIAILFITFIIFYILLINTKAFLLDLKVIEHRTHYVYDIIKFLIFFLIINTLDNYYLSTEGNLLLLSTLSFLTTFLILMLMIWRLGKFRKLTLLYSIIASLAVASFFIAFNSLFIINPLQLSLSLIFLFYISTAIIHHKLMHTLSGSVITEYIVVILLVVAITYGIT